MLQILIHKNGGLSAVARLMQEHNIIPNASRSTIYNWKKGWGVPARYVHAVAKLFGVDPLALKYYGLVMENKKAWKDVVMTTEQLTKSEKKFVLTLPEPTEETFCDRHQQNI